LKDVRLEAFLAESLVLWGIPGAVEGGDYPVTAVIRADDGTLLWVERPAAEDSAVRWLVRVRAAGEGPGGAREKRPRACASLVGVLKVLRGALGVDRGSAVRIAPAPADT